MDPDLGRSFHLPGLRHAPGRHAVPDQDLCSKIRMKTLNASVADDSRVGLALGTGANVLVGAESRPAGLKAQQAQKPAVGAGDSGPPPPGTGHRPAHFGQARPGRHYAARESSQRRSDSIKSPAPGDVITFHDRLQVPGRADDQRGMDVIVAEEFPYLTDGRGQRVSCGSGEHHLGSGAPALIHRSRIRTTVRAWSPAVLVILVTATWKVASGTPVTRCR
jgi:hypothetical protein